MGITPLSVSEAKRDESEEPNLLDQTVEPEPILSRC